MLIDAVILASLGIGFTGLRIPFCTSAVSFLSQNIRLVQGMMMLQFGQVCIVGKRAKQIVARVETKKPRGRKRLGGQVVSWWLTSQTVTWFPTCTELVPATAVPRYVTYMPISSVRIRCCYRSLRGLGILLSPKCVVATVLCVLLFICASGASKVLSPTVNFITTNAQFRSSSACCQVMRISVSSSAKAPCCCCCGIAVACTLSNVCN